MKTTTDSSPLTRLLSWAIALLLTAGISLFFARQSLGERENILPDDGKKRQPMRQSEQIKKEQAQRALPVDYSRQLVQQSEVLVRRELEGRLRTFQEMSEKMRLRRDNLLNRVETRKLSPSAAADANNTAEARAIPQVDDTPLAKNASLEDLYNRLRAYELEVQMNHLAANAARQALTKGLSFPEVYRSMKLGLSRMPTFDELIANQLNGDEWTRSAGSHAAAGLEVRNTADLNNYRGVLGQASRQAGLAGARLEGLFGLPRPGQAGGQASGSAAARGEGSGVGGDGGMSGANAPGAGRTPASRYRGARLDEAMVKAHAMPGRRFAKNADRKGWLYVNTWYMIGPWENYGREDFSIIHPPEVSIDFDAIYTDGQRGRGVIETDSHPIRVIGRETWLDGTLRWKFMQSESMHNAMPVTTGSSTYYAYTELYFDEETTMLVAIGTDDSGRVWINGKEVWQDSGTSWYRIDEHLAPFKFRQGWNSVLVRLENGGGGATGFSFLIVPG